MKEIERQSKDEIREERQVPVEKKKEYKYSLRPYAGQYIWQLELATGYVTKAKTVDTVVMCDNIDLGFIDIPNKDGVAVKKELVEKPGFLYIRAINKKNAVRKFTKYLESLPPVG